MTIKGQDWASYQSATPSTAGLAFAFVKATESTNYTNPKHTSQVAHARAAGLVVGHYHFQRPGDVAAQAAYFAAHAGVKAGDLIAVDWEDAGVSWAAKNSMIKALQAKYPHARVVLYCNRDFWLNRDTTSFCGDGLWIADPSAPAAGKPRVEHAWVMHQYSSAGGLDRNVANFASTAALKSWAAKDGTPASTPTQEDDMQPSDEVSTQGWFKTLWPTDAGLADGKITVRTAMVSGYGQARRARELLEAMAPQVATLTKTVAAQQAAITALSAKVGTGDDTAAIVTAVQQAIADAVVHVEVTTSPGAAADDA